MELPTGARSRKVTAILLRASSWINCKLISEFITATPRTLCSIILSAAFRVLLGVIIRVAENGVVTKLAGSDFETLDHFRKERIFNVGHNDSECAAVARSEVPRMHVGKISETPREYQQVRAPPYLARLVQDIGLGRSGYSCSLRDITNR